MNKLTNKQKRFCIEYLIDFNGKRAAIAAGYSKKTAAVISAQNLIKVNVQEYIREKQNKVEEKLGISREMILEGYRKLAFYDSRKFYDVAGNLINIPDLDDETSFALRGFEVTEEKGGMQVVGYTKKIRMSDRRAALDSIAKMQGYNAPEKSDVTIKQPFNDSQVDQIINALRKQK